MHYRPLLAALFAAFVFLNPFAPLAGAEQFPSKLVKFVVPQTPGGATDVFARKFAQVLSEKWGQPVIVENRAGAGGIVGTDVGREIRAGRPHATRDLCGLAGDQSEPLFQNTLR